MSTFRRECLWNGPRVVQDDVQLPIDWMKVGYIGFGERGSQAQVELPRVMACCAQ